MVAVAAPGMMVDHKPVHGMVGIRPATPARMHVLLVIVACKSSRLATLSMPLFIASARAMRPWGPTLLVMVAWIVPTEYNSSLDCRRSF